MTAGGAESVFAAVVSPQGGTSGGKAWFSAVVRRGCPLPHPPERVCDSLAKTRYRAVPLCGAKKRLVSTPSCSSRRTFLAMPPA